MSRLLFALASRQTTRGVPRHAQTEERQRSLIKVCLSGNKSTGAHYRLADCKWSVG